MTVSDLQRLYDYSYWANRRLLPVIAQLTPEEYTQPIAGTHGSIRNTMVHMLSAEWGWLDRCGGPARGPALKPEDYPSVDSLVTAWRTVEGHVRGFLADLKDEDLARTVEFTIAGGEKRAQPMGELLQHAANHGVHHRGQVSLLLRIRGHEPENFDLVIYDAEKRRAAAG